VQGTGLTGPLIPKTAFAGYGTITGPQQRSMALRTSPINRTRNLPSYSLIMIAFPLEVPE
jgi:hypothetical protein